MEPIETHVTDDEILREADGELSASYAAHVREHLLKCWTCRSRKAELEAAIAEFVQEYYWKFNEELPPLAESRAAFRANLSQNAAPKAPRRSFKMLWYAAAGALAVLLLVMIGLFRTGRDTLPDPSLTPGAINASTREQVCAIEDHDAARRVPAVLANAVFERYGIRNPRPGNYEIDYLIPPALGGSDDPKNLWPQPYNTGEWNAHVKDALEVRLRAMVCDGNLDLATAQRDIARDWITAYKQTFRADKPQLDHLTFLKDCPWE